ncbi:hypothetical protein NHX12_031537, partial [Muraenolepis orangiensis]
PEPTERSAEPLMGELKALVSQSPRREKRGTFPLTSFHSVPVGESTVRLHS